ncbi:nitrous oxide-stimulated promoter family protein [Dehalogenimonas alkenigignens]|uniref:Nitrous oxide-stimulated promoter n=1 Tax=Dehalogenimonas alkenigignens TaxID=1217799 RepID=A0A0W0GHW7_9CHLR|nr:nitrous oxide-stimulated promoter family protein [Dehalogenimonas alkenigignens]KTB48146.1 Nitrous oxide-stimulated promoter [Dehalogenimonas alkenigignens]PVV84386.1 nitrous oxide-stimulated promoter family protein [Dehalogenimonas alkenigignens]
MQINTLFDRSHHRLKREALTVRTMIAMYCRDRHPGDDLCIECRGLEKYALDRLRHCPFGEGKTVCALCPVHCYRPVMRQKVREVMRYAGPRMMTRHPLMAVSHLIDKRRKEPLKALNPSA